MNVAIQIKLLILLTFSLISINGQKSNFLQLKIDEKTTEKIPLPEKIKALVHLDGSDNIIGHRGEYGLFPEQTMISYLHAYQEGTNLLEIDIQITKDNVLVCFHDEYLDTVTDVNDHPEFEKYRKTINVEGSVKKNKIFVKDLTFDEIQTLRVKQRKSNRSHKYDGMYKIPSFDEFAIAFKQLNMINKKTTGVLIEIKSPNYYSDFGIDSLKLIKVSLEKHGLNDYNNYEEYIKFPVVIQSFWLEAIEYFSRSAGNSMLPLISLNKWSKFNDFKYQATMVDGITVARDFALYDRLDDMLVSNGKKYDSEEEFIKNVVKKGSPHESFEKIKEKMMSEKVSVYADHMKSTYHVEIGVYTLQNDSHMFNEDPVEEYLKLKALGFDLVYTDYPSTAVKALKSVEKNK